MNRIIAFLLALLCVEITVLTIFHYLIEDYPVQRELNFEGERAKKKKKIWVILFILQRINYDVVK